MPELLHDVEIGVGHVLITVCLFVVSEVFVLIIVSILDGLGQSGDPLVFELEPLALECLVLLSVLSVCLRAIHCLLSRQLLFSC